MPLIYASAPEHREAETALRVDLDAAAGRTTYLSRRTGVPLRNLRAHFPIKHSEVVKEKMAG
jgi:hypothetical protein